MRSIATKANINGQDCWVLTEPEKNKIAEYGELVEIKINHRKDLRSVEQLNLYWACCGIVADNAEWAQGSKNNVDRQCKIDCKFFADSFEERGGKVYVVLNSISLSRTEAPRAHEYFGRAFTQLAEYVGMSVEDLVAQAKANMQSKICRLCGKPAEHKHHLFSQTVWARQKYGKKIDHPKNIIWLCADCHLSKPIPKLTEKQFRKKIGLQEEE